MKSLAFLFEDPGAIDALNAVRMAQLRFCDMVAIDKFKNDAAVAILEILSEKAFPSFADAAADIGPHKIETMITVVRSVVVTGDAKPTKVGDEKMLISMAVSAKMPRLQP